MKTLSDQEKKKQQQLQEWLEQVHLSSCCSDIGFKEVAALEKSQTSSGSNTEVSKK